MRGQGLCGKAREGCKVLQGGVAPHLALRLALHLALHIALHLALHLALLLLLVTAAGVKGHLKELLPASASRSHPTLTIISILRDIISKVRVPQFLRNN